MKYVTLIPFWIKHRPERTRSTPLITSSSKGKDSGALPIAGVSPPPALPENTNHERPGVGRDRKRWGEKGRATITQNSTHIIPHEPTIKSYPIRLCPSEDARAYMLRGRQMLLDDQILSTQQYLPEEAFDVLYRAFEIEPENIAINFWAGQAARLSNHKLSHKKNAPRMAVDCFSKVVEANPGDFTAHLFYVLAIVEDKVKTGRPSRAVIEWAKHVGKANLERDQNDILASFIVAFCCLLFESNDEACHLIENLAFRLPENPLVISFLLTIYEDGLDIFLKNRNDRFKTKSSPEIIFRMGELIHQAKQIRPNFYEPHFCQSILHPGSVDHSRFSSRQQYYIAPFSMLSGPLIYIRPSLSEYFV